MPTQTLTYASTTTSTSSFTKLTIPNASSIPRTNSVESIKLIGRNPSPPPSKLQRSSSASEMLALVNLANLQRLHIRASEPSSSSGGLDSSLTSRDEDNDASSGSSSSSDTEECETPDQVSPPYTRPTSPIGYIYDYDSEDEESWDIRKVKYTAGAELAPCFARGESTATAAAAASSASSSLRSSFSDSEDDEEDDGMMMNNKKRSWSPGTPAIEKVEYHWSTTTAPSSSASSSTVATSLAMAKEEDGYFNDNGDDDDDMIGSELDADEVWPDEMDSDDFPVLHTWTHSWIWTPTDSPSTYSNPTPNPLPMIHFHFVESQVPDQSSWTPIQDSRFGGLLTVPGHRAYNSVETTKARLPRAAAAASAVVAPMQQLCEGAKVEYDDKLGRCAVKVPGLKEQREMGLYSIPSLSTSSSSSKKGRGRARSRARGMEDDEVDEADFRVEDGRGRGRTSARKSTVQSARHFVLSSIREADDGDEEFEEEPFVHDGVHGRARGLSRWD